MVTRSLGAQGRRLAVTLASLYAPLAVGAAYMSMSHGLPVKDFFQDAAVIGSLPAYAGSLSTVGVLLWCAAAVVCLLTAVVLWRAHGVDTRVLFLLSFAAISVILMADDAFMIHDALAPYYLGVSAEQVYAVYLVLVVGALTTFRRTILETDYVLLALSLAFLGASVVLDVLADTGVLRDLGLHSVDLEFLLEDGCKLLGIGGWFAYFGWVCVSYLSAAVLAGGAPRRAVGERPSAYRPAADDVGGDGHAAAVEGLRVGRPGRPQGPGRPGRREGGAA